MKGKQFVIFMIVGATVGIILMMIGMFVAVRGFLDKQEPAQEQTQSIQMEEATVPSISSVILGVVEGVTPERITIQDIEKKQAVEAMITLGTKVMDAYGKAMPLEMVEIGDLVQLTYNANEAELVSINSYLDAWKKIDIRSVEIDRSNRFITIGAIQYRYTDQTIIRDNEGNPINIYEVGDYDTLTLKGIGETIYSIQVTAKEAYLQLENIPTNEGVLEINTNRQIPMGMVTNRIPLYAGNHKIVVRLEGYDVIIEEISFEEGEVVTLDLAAAQRLTVDFKVNVMNEDVSSYTFLINGAAYPAGEVVTLFTGEHKVEIRAEGYEVWSKQVKLTEGAITLPVQLTPLPVQEEETEDEKEDTSNNENGLYTINVTTDPEDANVFIGDEKKGETPIKLELPIGTYTLRIEAEGYQTYETTILVEASDTKNNYYYMLIEK